MLILLVARALASGACVVMEYGSPVLSDFDKPACEDQAGSWHSPACFIDVGGQFIFILEIKER